MVIIIVGIIVFALVCLSRTRKHTKATAQNTAEIVRWAKLPSHLKELEYTNNLPRTERRAIMRQKMLEIHGEDASKWSHEDVRSAYNSWGRKQ
jgi:acyl-coenzyme A synthetase/AMP-(fatty) acid ligase